MLCSMETLFLVGVAFVVLVIVLATWSRMDTSGEAASMSIDEQEAQEAEEDVAEGKPPEPIHVQTPKEKADEEEYFEET